MLQRSLLRNKKQICFLLCNIVHSFFFFFFDFRNMYIQTYIPIDKKNVDKKKILEPIIDFYTISYRKLRFILGHCVASFENHLRHRAGPWCIKEKISENY